MYEFIPGLELNRRFFKDIIQPLLSEAFPDLVYSAALIGYGSDVIGRDNPTSMDHNWGPRCQIFLDKNSIEWKSEISDFLGMNLPFEFEGFPTNYTDPGLDSTQKMMQTNEYPINHLVEIVQIHEYFEHYLGIDSIEQLSEKDWIRLNDQALIEMVSGEVFHDGLAKLTEYRKKLSFYPLSIYKIRLASLWQMIANEEAFIGRCIELEDFIGLKIIVTRILNTLLKIAFYLEKRYIPYSKWFGSELKSLSNYHVLEPLANQLITESNPIAIDSHLTDLYQLMVNLHNTQLELPKLSNSIRDFYGRPYNIIHAESIVDKILSSIEAEDLKKINLDKVAMDLKIDSVDFTE
jgi:hypothetical protein